MKKAFVIFLASFSMFSATVSFGTQKEYRISIKDHKFDPAEIKIPSGEKIDLHVKNEDSSAEEFESSDLKREKIIKGNSEAKIVVGPLKPGRYKFVGEYHEDTAQGALVAE